MRPAAWPGRLQALQLLPALLDGLVWRSKRAINGARLDLHRMPELAWLTRIKICRQASELLHEAPCREQGSCLGAFTNTVLLLQLLSCFVHVLWPWIGSKPSGKIFAGWCIFGCTQGHRGCQGSPV